MDRLRWQITAVVLIFAVLITISASYGQRHGSSSYNPGETRKTIREKDGETHSASIFPTEPYEGFNAYRYTDDSGKTGDISAVMKWLIMEGPYDGQNMP